MPSKFFTTVLPEICQPKNTDSFPYFQNALREFVPILEHLVEAKARFNPLCAKGPDERAYVDEAWEARKKTRFLQDLNLSLMRNPIKPETQRVCVWAISSAKPLVSLYLYLVVWYVMAAKNEQFWNVIASQSERGYVSISHVFGPTIDNVAVLSEMEVMKSAFSPENNFIDRLPKSPLMIVDCTCDPHESKAKVLSEITNRSVYGGDLLRKHTIFIVRGTLDGFFESMKWKLDQFAGRIELYQDYDKVETRISDFESPEALKALLRPTHGKAEDKPAEKPSEKPVTKPKTSGTSTTPLCIINLKAGNKTCPVSVFSDHAEIECLPALTHYEWFMKHKDRFSSAQDVTDAITKAVHSDSWPKGRIGYVMVKSADIEKIPSGGYMSRYKCANLSTVETLEAITR